MLLDLMGDEGLSYVVFACCSERPLSLLWGESEVFQMEKDWSGSGYLLRGLSCVGGVGRYLAIYRS